MESKTGLVPFFLHAFEVELLEHLPLLHIRCCQLLPASPANRYQLVVHQLYVHIWKCVESSDAHTGVSYKHDLANGYLFGLLVSALEAELEDGIPVLLRHCSQECDYQL